MSWLKCFVFCFTLGSAWVFTALDSLPGAGLSLAFLLIYIFIYFCFSCISLSHVLVNFYVFGISILLFFRLYYVFGLRLCYSSFMNYYVILYSSASYSDCSVSVILYIWFHLLQIYSQSVISHHSSLTCVDYCRFEWYEIGGCYTNLVRNTNHSHFNYFFLNGLC